MHIFGNFYKYFCCGGIAEVYQLGAVADSDAPIQALLPILYCLEDTGALIDLKSTKLEHEKRR
ncbi:hypothetical protein [Halalkalibacter akibai]|uniref:Uncharacterized protein n=1 Tax=Halalkalibacter akibai (strain ATCC 43226 / DSM 21942 / CIP 109018 / JCM 9157 / 1139) TaxID=1236973 RepID=W4QS83_HALA3|nr:hypothetical protein [Halalkalibacter akibai]GAE34936.1 hypothetical protein JCM9157_2020 [Halalkalibacter akibai JCM 9157]